MNMLPIVEILDGCQTDAERADWLLRVPDGVVLRDFDQITAILLTSGCRLGAEFLRVRLAGLHATRDGRGDLPAGVRGTLAAAFSAMRFMSGAVRPEGGLQ